MPNRMQQNLSCMMQLYYGFALLAPLLHTHAHSPESLIHSSADKPAETEMVCAGPCHIPSHNHLPPNTDHHCVLCQLASSTPEAILSVIHGIPTTTQTVIQPVELGRPYNGLPVLAQCIRGPPSPSPSAA
ncbi:MAG: hypothetical protein HJJLKODD_01450 [Phycisphaerae bacterium]|nr:hypothetical protein [Phycisphaerae bacterium]